MSNEETFIDRDRRAELTLLAIMEEVPEESKNSFLLEHGVTRAEYDRLCEKYSRVLKKAREEKQKEATQ